MSWLNCLSVVIWITCFFLGTPCYLVLAQEQGSCQVPGTHAAQRITTRQGTITVGCPKLWVSDRIFTVLDGMLRDVDSINLKSLQGLDPNSVTGADLLSIVNEFQANLKYDQGAAVGNAFKLQKANAVRAADLEQFNERQKANAAVVQQEGVLQQRMISLQQKEYALTAAGKSAQDPELKQVQAEETLVSSHLTTLKGMETAAPTIQDQNISSSDTTQATAATATAAALDSDALTKAFGDVLKNPKLPAAMQMDNVIDLLRQRLAREFGVMYDDLSRQSSKYAIYLAQFDVGLLPGHDGKKRHPRVIIQFTDSRILAYDLFPVGAAYNTATGQARTTRIGITGAAQTLFGFGLSAAYNHSRNQLRSSLSQTMYVSAFGAGSSQFGWTFGTAPFEDFVSPGSRPVYAIVLVPKGLAQSTVQTRVTTCWVKEGRGRSSDCTAEEKDLTFNFSLPDPVDPKHPSQKLVAISYQPYNQRSLSSSTSNPTRPPAPALTPPPAPAAAGTPAIPAAPVSTAPALAPAPNSAQPDTNTVQLVFYEPIDPNMTITVGDKILRRVRDVRGRALYGAAADTSVLAGNQSERDALTKSRFGILETDTPGPDTWFQLNSTTALLTIARETAGTDVFPVIRVSDPRSGGRDVFAMASDTVDKNVDTTIRIGEWQFSTSRVDNMTSAFVPLFTEPYDSGRIHVFVDDVSKTNPPYPTKIRIVSETHRAGRTSPVWLHEQAQVVMEAEQQDLNWALNCYGEEGTLICEMPTGEAYTKPAGTSAANYKIWVDQPPYFERPGLWADDDLRRESEAGPWEKQPYAVTDWSDVREVCSPNSEKPNSPEKNCPDSWHARIKVKHLEDTKYCLAGLPDVSSLNERIDALKKNGAKSGSQTQEIKLLQGFVKSSTAGGLENGEVKKVGDCPDVAVTLKVRGGYLSLDIPFDRFPYVLDRTNLERRDCKNSECEDLALPDLRSHLLPSPVTITDLKQGDYRIQGEHLKAVQEIQLSRGGSAVPYTPTVGVNNVDFTVKNKLDPGTYNVFFVIQTIPIPATYVDEHDKRQQLVLVIPPKETKSPVDSSTKKNKTSAKPKNTSPPDAEKANGSPPAQPVPPAKKDEGKKDESKKNDRAAAPK